MNRRRNDPYALRLERGHELASVLAGAHHACEITGDSHPAQISVVFFARAPRS
jgi:hypothetical protein